MSYADTEALRSKAYVCNSCLHPFSSQRVLDNHVPYCLRYPPQQVMYPNPKIEKERIMKFRSQRKQHYVPFVLFSGFECFLTSVDDEDRDGVEFDRGFVR